MRCNSWNWRALNSWFFQFFCLFCCSIYYEYMQYFFFDFGNFIVIFIGELFFWLFTFNFFFLVYFFLSAATRVAFAISAIDLSINSGDVSCSQPASQRASGKKACTKCWSWLLADAGFAGACVCRRSKKCKIKHWSQVSCDCNVSSLSSRFAAAYWLLKTVVSSSPYPSRSSTSSWSAFTSQYCWNLCCAGGLTFSCQTKAFDSIF